MLLDVLKQVLLYILLGISGISAVARIDNWSQKKPNNTVAVQNQQGQAGYRPAVGFQQPLPEGQWNRYNQTQGQSYNNHHQQPQPQWQPYSNRTQYNNQPSASQANQNPWIRNNQTQYYPPQPIYGQGSYNKTQGWGQSTNSHVYPMLPNNTQIPNIGDNGRPLAPLQTQNSQGPQNWQSGGQSALSYGAGSDPYSQPAGTHNNNLPSPQGGGNPYANMFH